MKSNEPKLECSTRVRYVCHKNMFQTILNSNIMIQTQSQQKQIFLKTKRSFFASTNKLKQNHKYTHTSSLYIHEIGTKLKKTNKQTNDDKFLLNLNYNYNYNLRDGWATLYYKKNSFYIYIYIFFESIKLYFRVIKSNPHTTERYFW